MLAFSEACERNKQPILECLQSAFADCRYVLEIGSGTGQHAVHFAAHLQHLRWSATDRREHLNSLQARLTEARLPNLDPACELDINQDYWPGPVDGIFTANTLHIMSSPEVTRTFAGIGRSLSAGGTLCIYGPFKYGGAFTSESNARFDAGLRERDPNSGIRDIEAVSALAAAERLALTHDYDLPANNRLLVFKKTGG
jgi:cyclopropane fatty-acyl-phospholipid synthase-like methyltransferase